MRGIARLAQELGISAGTVSRALNGKPDVNEKTRSRVLEAAQRLGYAPNQAARSLAQGVTQSIGFMMELDRESAVSNDYFFMGVFDGMQSVLAHHGLDLLVLPCARHQDRYAYLERFVSRSTLDGIVLATTQHVDKRIEFLQSAGVPFVTLGRSSTGHGYSWIDLDFETAMTTVFSRLVAKGHRRIAIALPRDDVNYGTIYKQAYLENLERHGIEFDPSIVFHTHRSEDAATQIVDEILANPIQPTAALLIYEVTVIGVYRRLRDLGLEPGRDLAIVGFRDEPTLRFLSPSVTCFHLSLSDLGVSLAGALLAQIPAYAKSFKPGIVQALTPMTLKAGESDVFGPNPAMQQRPLQKRQAAGIRDPIVLKD